jgi:hypothetical protein
VTVMTVDKHNSRLLIVPLLLLILVWPARARAQSSPPQELIEPRLNLSRVLDKLVEKNAERADALQKYQGRRYYRLDYTGFPHSFHAEMVVDMIYDAPATKQFKIISQSGSQWIIDRILKRLLEAEQEALNEENRERVALNSRNYDFGGFEDQDTPNSCSYHLTVQPKIPSKLLYRGRIWVDGKDFAVCRIDAEPAKNPSFWIKKTAIRQSYLKVGDFWLPSENESISAVRGGGRAVLNIKYGDYEILAARSLKGHDAGLSSSSLALPNRSN